MRLGLVCAAWWASACYRPTAQVGLPCSPNHTCPGAQVCDLGQSPPICVDELVDAGAGADGPPIVVCTTNTECSIDAPICDPEDKVCRPCVADADCDGACHELTGRCVAEANILYVTPSGTNNSTCTKATPCVSVDVALQHVSTTRSFIRVADGVYTDDWNFKQQGGLGGASAIISGTDLDPAGAEFSPTLSNLGTDGNTTLVLEGVTIRNPQQSGLVVRGMATVSHVLVDRVPSTGIEVRPAGTLVVLDSRIQNGQGVGISSANSVEVQRSQLLGNTGGGITATGAFTILNTVIANNGTPLAGTFGGARLVPAVGKPAVFRFNTVTKNAGGSVAAGVQCDAAISVEDSIVHGNMGLLFPELGASCAPSYCLLATAPATGNNVQGNPMFVNAASDFHVLAGSPAIDMADPAATETMDFEGGPRPRGSRRDIGADEQP